MGKDPKKTKGDTYIRVDTDKKGREHIDIYDKDPRGPHNESIHITLNSDGSGRITTKSDDNPRKTTDFRCFLTTACMHYFKDNFDDNCYELTMMRWLRDNVVNKDDIEYYYTVAPLIVKIINFQENKNIIYDYIYNNIINNCIKQIEGGNYIDAYATYKNGFLSLEEYYVKPVLHAKLVKVLKCK